MGGVKNVGAACVDAIVRDRGENGPYTDIFDFCRRMGGEEVNKRAVDSLVRAGCFDHLGANRAQVCAVYEKALDSQSGIKKQNVAGQVSLFDMGMPAQKMDIQETYPPLEEYPKEELLRQEKEMTGVYCSGHPLDEYAPILDAMPVNTAYVAELTDRDDKGLSEDGKPVKMGGIIVASHAKATKKGAMMGFLTLEDLTGQIEGLVFPRVYEVYGHDLSGDRPVLISGKLSVREEDDTKLLVDTIEPLMSAQPRDDRGEAQRAKEAAVRLFLRAERALVPRIEQTLGRFSGAIPVYLNIPGEGVTLLFPREMWCADADDMRGFLTPLLGAENIKVVKKQ